MLYLRVCVSEVTLLYASRGAGERRKEARDCSFEDPWRNVKKLQRGNVLFMCPPSLPSPSLHACASICLKQICLSKMGLELPPVLGLGPGGPGVELHCLPIFIFIRNGRLHKEPR